MKAAERDHVKAVGEDKFNRAIGLAMVAIRQDSRLIGLDKVRNALAEEAAFRATGFKEAQGRAFNLPKNAGHENLQEMLDICAEIMPTVVEAASV